MIAIPIEGESPVAVDTWNAMELLQTVVAQQVAYSYSHEQIHSTPRPSYSRRIESPAVSNSE